MVAMGVRVAAVNRPLVLCKGTVLLTAGLSLALG